MEYLEIVGKNRLSGEVHINGAKNAAVAIIPAAILSDGVCIIENLPCIEDVTVLVNALNSLGAVCSFKNNDPHVLIVDSRGINKTVATGESIKKIRASYYMLGALLGRFKHAEVAMPGGCNFGSRPIDQHIKGFEALGAKVTTTGDGRIIATADRLVGTTIYLDVVSVGATINIMLAAVFAEGTTTIENAAKEPHIVDTANFMNSMGANIKGAGTDLIRIKGVDRLHGSEYMIIPDQIEAGTYMIAAAITGGRVTVRNLIPKHMDSLAAKLLEMNCKVDEGDDYITVTADVRLQSVNVKTMTYPGFPTDLQPQMTALLCVADGTGVITETVWENRFQYVEELRRLGGSIIIEGRVAVIQGNARLVGARTNATDLRAGAALVMAGLAAEGRTTIGNVKYLDRGYEDLENKLRRLGADIRRVQIEE